MSETETTVTYDQAWTALRQYVNLQFNKPGDKPIAHIPAQQDRDTDLVLGAYLRQTRDRITTLERELAEAKAKLETAENSARVLLRGADFEVDSLRAQLTAANATIAACKAAGFIDAEGRVRKVGGSLPITADGAIAGVGAELWADFNTPGIDAPMQCAGPAMPCVPLARLYLDREAAAAAKEAQ